MNKNLTQIRSDIEEHLQSPSSVPPSTNVLCDQTLAKLMNEIENINCLLAYDVRNHEVQSLAIQREIESLKIRQTTVNIAREKSKSSPCKNGTSLHEEILAASAPDRVDLDIVSDTATEQLISKCGHSWKLSDWNNRLSRLESRNNTSYKLKNCPGFADANWIVKFFNRKYHVRVSDCQSISSRCFKFQISSKYDWMFLHSGDVLRIGKMQLSRLDHNIKPNTQSNTTKNDPNWSLKMGIIPNFSQLNPISSFKRKTSPTSVKPPAKRVSFNVPTFARNTSTSTDPKPSRVSYPGLGYCPPTTNTPNNKTAYLPNFVHSHTLNPGSSPVKKNNVPQKSSTPNVCREGYLNPMIPPNVKLTKELSNVNIEDRYVMSRLRDHKIYSNVRLYLAFLHDKPDSVCFEGKTNTNIKVLISQEGLPTSRDALMKIFLQFHDGLDISPKKVKEDLSSFASFISSKRISYLQKSRSDMKSFYRS